MEFVMADVILKPGRDKPIRQHHPWIFSGAVARVKGNVTDGDAVEVVASDGTWLARGMLNRQSQIIVRLLTWKQDEAIDRAFWRSRLERAMAGRAMLASSGDTTAYRLVSAESDGLPGLILDRYGDWLVMQFLALGVERWKSEIVGQISNLSYARGVYERSDVDVRAKEGLPQTMGVLSGDEPPDLVEIRENGLRFLVDVKRGHKTGFYLDQRDNRRKVAPYLRGREVLNCFAYTGAFAVYALSAGAKSVTNVDTSAEALELARRNVDLNASQFCHSERSEESPSRKTETLRRFAAQGDTFPGVEFVVGDVFAELRRLRAEGRLFDAIILDPPKFAQNDQQLKRAARGYQDINRVAMNILRPDGILATFSCSGLVSPDLFQKIIFSASLEAERDVQIVEKLGQASCHPILATLPESEYLKGFVCRVY
jgi:23S rRNA (cytosine1962-C5)-methyltransferase